MMLSKRMTEKRRDATAVAAIRTRMINRSRPLVLRPVSPLKKLLPTLAAMVLSILEWYWKAGRHKHKRTPKLPAPPASTTRQSVPTPDLPAKSVSPPHLSRLETPSLVHSSLLSCCKLLQVTDMNILIQVLREGGYHAVLMSVRTLERWDCSTCLSPKITCPSTERQTLMRIRETRI